MAFDRESFPSEAVQYVTPSHRVRRVAHYMAAMGLWRPPSNPGVSGSLLSSSCNACLSCSDCFPNLPEVVGVDCSCVYPDGMTWGEVNLKCYYVYICHPTGMVLSGRFIGLL